ncbi:hypothetical protein JIG36_14990 [Actinoplanes sp. LDG1-06]|uniref:Uncharacterized protein n=1 Tax=Paractinoplanes ovalisporus TaxID=2810368 RepID=A0ABS2AAS5_9ACTN|nr:hypothetical protein [Actinoplanes ovalisporus]MBM2616865.1 hypothetical protein [Actinoplanes ovalisporus]
MTARPRPLIAVRLVGPADTVAAHKAHLIEHFQHLYGPTADYRSTTRHGSHQGECRTYLSVTQKETRTMTPEPLQHNENPTSKRQENTR